MTQLDRLLYDLRQAGVGDDDLSDLQWLQDLRQTRQLQQQRIQTDPLYGSVSGLESAYSMTGDDDLRYILEKKYEELDGMRPKLTESVPEEDDSFSFWRTFVSGPVLGVIEGLTTLPVGIDPRNTAESISSSAGHLLGFIGLGASAIFSGGSTTIAAGSLRAISGAARLTGATARAAGAVKGGKKALDIANASSRFSGKIANALKSDFISGNAAKGISAFRSVPMLAADKVMKSAAYATAAKSASAYLGNSAKAMVAKNVMKSGMHLGIASAASNVWHGPAAIMESAIGGAVAGGLFKGIAHIPGLTGKSTLHNVLRGTAGATIMTHGEIGQLARGEYEDINVANLTYNALLGAYFGFKEMPWYRSEPLRYIQDQHAINKVKPYLVNKMPETQKWLKTFGPNEGKVRKELNDITNDLGSIADVPEIERRMGKMLGINKDRLFDVDVKDMTDVQNLEFNLKHTKDILDFFKKHSNDAQQAADIELDPIRKENWHKDRRSADDSIKDIEKKRAKIKKLYEEAVKEQQRVPKVTGKDADDFEATLHRLNKYTDETDMSEPDYKKMIMQYGNDIIKISQQDPNAFESMNMNLLDTMRKNKFSKHIKTYIDDNPDKRFIDTPVAARTDENLITAEGKYDRAKLYNNDIDIPIFSEPKPLKEMMDYIGDKVGWDAEVKQEHIGAIAANLESIVGPLKIIHPKTGRKVLPLHLKDQIWSKFSENLEKEYEGMEGVDPVEVKRFINEDLKRSFNTQIQEQPVRQISYDQDTGYVNSRYEFDTQQNRIIHKESEVNIHDLVRDYNIVDPEMDALIQFRSIIKNNVEGRKSNTGLVEGELTQPDYWKVIEAMHLEGYHPYSGRDASEVINFVPYNIGSGELGKAERANWKAALDGKYGKGTIDKMEKAVREEAVDLNVTPEQARDMVMSNINYWAMENSIYPKGSRPRLTKEDYARTMEDGFVSDLLSFNKRAQMMFTNMPKLDPAGNMEFKAMAVEDYAKELAKKDKKYNFEPASDGGDTMEELQFKSLLKAAGINQDSSVVQAWVMRRGKKGMFFTKAAIHKADPEHSKAMRDAGVDWLIPGTSAKQNAGVKFGTDKYKGDSLDLGKGEIIPIKGDQIRIEMNRVYDDVSKAKLTPEVIKRQMLTNLTKEMSSEKELFDFQTWLKKESQGRNDVNELMKKYLHLPRHDTEEAQNMLRGLNIDDMSIHNIDLGLRTNDEGFARKFWSHATRSMALESNKGIEYKDDLMGSEYNRKMDEDLVDASYLDRILPLAHIPSVRMHKHFGKMFDKIYMNYLVNRVTEPLVRSSGHGTLAKLDSSLQRKLAERGFDITKKEGREPFDETFFLDNGWKDWTGWATKAERRRLGAKTLEDAFKKVETDPGIAAKLESAVTRIPIAEFSGTQMLKFGGFTGTSGGRILVSPRVMERLSGADLDIDGGYFYMGLPKSYTDPMRRAAKQQDTMKDYSDEFIRPNPDLEYKDEYFGMFLPWHRIKMAETVMQGRGRLIQEAQRSKIIINNMMSEALDLPGRKLVDKTSGKEIVFTAAEDNGELFRAKAKAATGVAVDAGKYGGTITTPEVQAKLLEAAFPEITINGTKVTDLASFIKDTIPQTTYQTRMNTRSALWGKIPNSSAGKLLDILKQHPESDTSTLGMFAREIAGMKHPDTFLSLIDVGGKTAKDTGFYRVFDSINKFLVASRKNETYGPEAAALANSIPIRIKDRFLSVPTETLIKKMQAAKTYSLEDKTSRELWLSEETFPTIVKALKPELNHKTVRKISDSRGTAAAREKWIEKQLEGINSMISDNVSDVVGLKTVLKHALMNEIPIEQTNWMAMEASLIRNKHAAYQRMLNDRNDIAKQLNTMSGDEVDVPLLASKIQKTKKGETLKDAEVRSRAYLNDNAALGLLERSRVDGKDLYRTIGDLPKDTVSLLAKQNTSRLIDKMRMDIGNDKVLQDHFDYNLLSTFKLQEYNKEGDTSTSKLPFEKVEMETLGKYMNEYEEFFNDIQSGLLMQDNLPAWGSEFKKADTIIASEKGQLASIKDLLHVPGLGKEFATVHPTGELSPRGLKVWNQFVNELTTFRDRYGDQEWMTGDGIMGMLKGFSGGARPQDIVLEDIQGFINRMRYWRKGFGVFDFIAKLRGKKEGEVRWKHWMQFSEKVADDFYTQDLFLVAKKGALSMTSDVTGETKKVFGDFWQPMNHMHKLIHHVNNSLDLGAAAAEKFQHRLEDDDKLSILRSLETKEGSRESNEDLFQLAVRNNAQKGAWRWYREMLDKREQDPQSVSRKAIQKFKENAETEQRRYDEILKSTELAEDLEFVYTSGVDKRIAKTRDEMANIVGDKLENTQEFLFNNLMSMDKNYEDKHVFYRGRDKYGSKNIDINKTWESLLGQIIDSSILKEPIRYDAIRLLAHEFNFNDYAVKNVDEYLQELSTREVKVEYDNTMRTLVKDNDVYNALVKTSNTWKLNKDPNGQRLNSFVNNLMFLNMTTRKGRADYLRSAKTPKSPAGMGKRDAIALWKQINGDQVVLRDMSPVNQEFFDSGALYKVQKATKIYTWERGLQDNPSKSSGVAFLRARQKYDNGDYRMKQGNLDMEPTPRRYGYWHHTDWDPIVLQRQIREKIAEIESSDASLSDKQAKIKAIHERFMDIRAEEKSADMNMNADEANLITKFDLLDKPEGRTMLEQRQLDLTSATNKRAAAAMTRESDLDGYSEKFDVMEKYVRMLNKAIYTKAGALLSRRTIDNFIQKKSFGDQTENWANYLRMYARDSLGYPSMIPEAIYSAQKGQPLHDPLNLKYSLYKTLSDENVMDFGKPVRDAEGELVKDKYGLTKYTGGTKLNKIFRMLHRIKSRPWRAERMAFKQDHGRDMTEDEREELIKRRMAEFSPTDIAAISNLEAKYEVASLLSHTKTMANNIFGGSANTWIYTGTKHMWNAYKMPELNKINREWKNREDVDRTLSEWGVIEEMMTNELNLRKEFIIPKYRRFASDVMDMIKRDPSMDDKSLLRIAKDNNISSDFMNKSAWFMRKSERILRSNAFLASYMQAREQLLPVVTEYNNEFLIERGKAGVKATQFLYNAAQRPAFARTSAGKVFSRLKLWSWNSVRFRRETYQAAKFGGFNPGTQEYERFQRMITADMIMIGLAALFPFSMFENAMPQPYQWFQNFGQWLGGATDEEKERAFYGNLPISIAPLQELVPVILRGPTTAFGALFNLDKLTTTASYTMWSMFPFGRIGHSVWKSMEKPILAPYYFSGLPYHRFGYLAKGSPTTKPFYGNYYEERLARIEEEKKAKRKESRDAKREAKRLKDLQKQLLESYKLPKIYG